MALFHRTEMARYLAGELLEPKTTHIDGSKDMIFSGPLGWGKSTFLREDLRPTLEAQGALVVYADFWDGRRCDPADVLLAAIRRALRDHDSAVGRLARLAGMDCATVGDIAFALRRGSSGISLGAAFACLAEETGQPIIVMLDEIQHAATTQRGSDALAALAATREEFTTGRYAGVAPAGFKVVATGSNYLRLSALLADEQQAFDGCCPFPPLGYDYVKWVMSQLPCEGEIDVPAVYKLFAHTGYRPQLFGAAASALQQSGSRSVGEYTARLASLVRQQRQVREEQALHALRGLNGLEHAVLRTLTLAGTRYAPLEAESLQQCRHHLAHIDPGSEVVPDAASVTQALRVLQERALIWRDSRGVFAAHDDDLAQRVATLSCASQPVDAFHRSCYLEA